MEKSKRIKSECQDRLSELPDSLIFHIFSFMAMTDVVKTTILSNRWKNLWTTAPTLNFDDFKMEIDDDTDDLFLKRVENFIKRVLIFWRGARIQEFKIDFGKRFNKSIYDDIDLWLQFAKEYKVETLYVHFGNDSIQPTQEMYWVPQCLYSCSSLKWLCLEGCNFHIPIKNVNWNQLKYLNIDGYGLGEDLINKVLSGSPQLEVFILHFVENNDNLTIESSSLKHLFIDKYLYYDTDNPSVDTELRISTPNLESLEIGGVPYSKCLMNNVPSITCANLFFDGPLYYSHQLFSGNDFVGETLRQILPTVQHVERVSFSDWCIKALGDMKNKNMLSPFPNVEELKLNGCFEEYKQVASLLEIFPDLEKLVLQQEKDSKEYHGNRHQHGCRESFKFEANLPNSFLQKLRIIVITWAEGEDSILPLIEILLKYASKLRKMVFRVKETAPPSNSLLLALLRMPRSSPTAELIFSTIPDE